MLKVDQEALINDYLALIDKRTKGYEASEIDAKVFAQAHGYNEQKTKDFIKFVQDLGKGGLSVVEQHKLEHLGAYIQEVPDAEELEEPISAVAIPAVNSVAQVQVI